jgi:hypothetical protein
VYELRRIHLLRTRVNRDKKEGRSPEARTPALLPHYGWSSGLAILRPRIRPTPSTKSPTASKSPAT